MISASEGIRPPNSLSYATQRALLGLSIAPGAPLGWFLIRCLEGATPGAELLGHAGLYAYMLLGTGAVFAVFGLLLGQREDRLCRANARLEDRAVTDPLTGLKNGGYFHARLEEEFLERARTGEPLAVVVLDLDRFKGINDTYGHLVGDLVLIRVGRAIASVTREGETDARVGGEEFALLLPGSTSEEAREVAERVRNAIAEAETVIEGESTPTLRVTASAGAASTTDTKAASARALYKATDQALYRAKAEGRDRTVVARDPMPGAAIAAAVHPVPGAFPR